MESIRSLTGLKPRATDEEIFVEEIMLLLTPHLIATVNEMENETGQVLLATQITAKIVAIQAVIQRLLSKFFKLAQTDKGLSKFMIPIMMYLRSARMKRGVR